MEAAKTRRPSAVRIVESEKLLVPGGVSLCKDMTVA